MMVMHDWVTDDEQNCDVRSEKRGQMTAGRHRGRGR
jgi:hypothetical protein